ncbi:MAG: carboxy terminal-processing peptidase [Winogradskyella sp.]|uniref:carboxy terminal-processing peptidase n=1 Tax=Winogradskyella sp. TaxID=1883156 RepID=UPI0017CB3D65|nr:carboxy terminal-processing peptidase [Winogradskyella sp.]MBT8245590.1 carboxy terminal-processing peptidase [Winogradskyella sp.]NNK22860.1 carboxy terminal-processing peptidase [Winogradskyella sp.]
MKGKYKFLLLALLIAVASCSFTSKVDGSDSDKDKLLVRIITYLLDQGHFAPQDINDDFSERVYEDYIKQLDPFKRYFYESDIEEFNDYKNKIDDQLKAYDLSFFELTHKRLIERTAESKEIYSKILNRPFDYSKDEQFNSDYEELGYVKNKREMKERWRQQLKFSTIANYDEIIENNKTLASNDPDVSLKSIKELEVEARETTKKSLEELYTYMEERRRKDWFGVYINAIVREFDPHTFYFSPEDKDRFDVDMSGKFEGIGARLQRRLDVISISELISGGPAWRQNELEPGDQILKVKQEDEEEGVSIVGMRLEDAVKFIKGPKGTSVTLTLKKVDGSIKDISIERDEVVLEETYAKSSTVIKDGKKYGLINLPSFYDNFDRNNRISSAIDVKKEIQRLKKDGIEGVILDLRDNRGGSLGAVVDMAGLFIEEGPIVQVKSTTEPKRILSDTDKSIVWDGPLVIMVNELSASASEILAAAMQDYKRAVIIGSEQTFGKGTVQNVVDLNRMVRNNSNGDLGAIKFTTDKYYRINGGSTQLEGVKSDIVVADRYKYIGIGERTQDNPLSWDKIDSANYNVWQNYYDYDTAIKNSKKRIANNNQLSLIDENAKWINDIRENEVFSLNYEDYKKRLELNEEQAKRFDKISDYKTNLTFQSLPYELNLIAKDSILAEKRKRWHTSLSKDVYVEEALNVLNDLKLSYTINNNVAQMKN